VRAEAMPSSPHVSRKATWKQNAKGGKETSFRPATEQGCLPGHTNHPAEVE